MTALLDPPVRMSFSTSDELLAREAIDAVIGAQVKVRAGPDPMGQISVDAISSGELSVGQTSIPFDVDAFVPHGGGYVFSTLTSGVAEYEGLFDLRRYGRGDSTMVSDGSVDVRCRGFDSAAQSWSLSGALLNEVAAQHPDFPVGGWRFTQPVPRPGAAGQWRRTAIAVRALLKDPESSRVGLVMGPAVRLLAATALTVWPNTAVTEPARSDGPDGHSDTLRRAVAFIEANPDVDISIGDVARAACVTTRAVQLAFRRHLDTTPMRYLRQVRLHEARSQLEAATARDGTTVTRVAMDWGFANPSHFTSAYKEAFGELPSETLSR